MMEEINKHMRGQRKGAETKGQMKRKRERLEERHQAWLFVVENKVLLNDLLVPCIDAFPH